MLEMINQADPRVQSALISAVVALLTIILGTPLRYILDKRSLSHRLEIEYEYEQKKRLRELIGKYHSRMLEAATSLNYRIWNLYSNESKGWLDKNGRYENLVEDSYYYTSTIYRFITVLTLVRQFENEAMYIDVRIARSEDMVFMKYLKALHWVCTDASLFDGLEYDASRSIDHFFSDNLKSMCDTCCSAERQLSLSDLENIIKTNDHFLPLLTYFDGLKRYEDTRYRWDRLISLDLLLMAFINQFGYDMQKTSKDQFKRAVLLIENKIVLKNLGKWLAKLGLDKQKEARANIIE